MMAFISGITFPVSHCYKSRCNRFACSTTPPNSNSPQQQQPQRPRDPTDLRTESEIRRNQPVKPMRRRARRRQVDDPLDWDNLPSVPLVRREASPESGEDYWVDIADTKGDKTKENETGKKESEEVEEDEEEKRKNEKVIDENLKNRLKQEVVSPYTENWILRVTVVVLVLIALVAIFGGSDKAPIISLPDL